MEETTVKIVDKISDALDGRSQRWLVGKLNELSETIPVEELEIKYKLQKYDDTKLSRKMNEIDEFEPYELKAISKILKIKF